MIVVTLGTHPKPMDRLMVALDDLVAAGSVEHEVVVTAAAYSVRPPHITTLGIQPFNELQAMIDAARAVITHGGPASIALALAAGHTPIIVPREPKFHEHVDDHQVRFSTWIATRRPVYVVREMTELKGALLRVLTVEAGRIREPFVPWEAIERLRAVISSGG